MIKEVVSARVSADIAVAIRARADADGLKLSEVMEQALLAYLGMSDGASGQGPNLVERLTDVEQRVTRLEQQASAQADARVKGKRRR